MFASMSESTFDCAAAANSMSCDAQIGLAKAEASRNDACLYYTANPIVCDRLQSLADRGQEHTLQIDKTLAMSRKLCVTKTKLYQTGSWEAVMDQTVHPMFDQRTKSR